MTQPESVELKLIEDKTHETPREANQSKSSTPPEAVSNADAQSEPRSPPPPSAVPSPLQEPPPQLQPQQPLQRASPQQMTPYIAAPAIKLFPKIYGTKEGIALAQLASWATIVTHISRDILQLHAVIKAQQKQNKIIIIIINNFKKKKISNQALQRVYYAQFTNRLRHCINRE